MSLDSERRQLLDEKLSKILMQFKLSDLRRYGLAAFQNPALTWDLIERAVSYFKLSLTKQDIGKLLLEYTKDLNENELKVIYSNLLLLELMLHPAKKIWTAVNMKQGYDIPLDEDCALSITKAFRKKSKLVNVYTDISNNVRWFVIIVNERTENQGIIQKKPIYIAHPLETSYIFCSPKCSPSETLTTIVSGFGYINYKVLKLCGRNIPSLIKMLDRHKEADQLRTKLSSVLKNSKDNHGVKSSKGTNFCQDKVRSIHAKEMFGDSLQLENLVVHAETEWRGVRTLPEAEGKMMNVTMKIRSKNVVKSLEQMMKFGVIKPPYPKWLTEFSLSGKNEIRIGQDAETKTANNLSQSGVDNFPNQ